MKQTSEQLMTLVGHDIFLSNAIGVLRKAKVIEFRYNGNQRSLKIRLGYEQDYKIVIVTERELEARGCIMISMNLIKPIKYIEGDLVGVDV